MTIMTYKIQANASGTRSIEVTEAHLETLRKYDLLHHLVDSNGIVDESVVNKLKLNVRSLLESAHGNDNALLDLCLDVVYHQNMKAIALEHLIQLYKEHAPKGEVSHEDAPQEETSQETGA